MDKFIELNEYELETTDGGGFLAVVGALFAGLATINESYASVKECIRGFQDGYNAY